MMETRDLPVSGRRSPAPSLRDAYFRDDHESQTSAKPEPLLRPALEKKLNFQYRGDVFGQHGLYSDASLYMSRLPSSRKSSLLRPKAGAPYRLQALKLAPVEVHSPCSATDQQSADESTGPRVKPNKPGRKRQYALAIEAMASNPMLRGSLLNDNVVPTLLNMLRSKDATTVSSCVATLCYLSGESMGREAILKNSALTMLTGLSSCISPSPEQAASRSGALLHNYLATLANLTIEDTYESVFVKEKGLESVMKLRKASEFAEQVCTFTLFNLSCPVGFSYARIDDVVRAITDYGRDARSERTRLELSKALYNISCTRGNQIKIVEADAIGALRLMMTAHDVGSSSTEQNGGECPIRLNALMTLWRLADNPVCRRAVTRLDCVRALVQQLDSWEGDADVQLKCTLMILLSLAQDVIARQRLGKAGALDAIARTIARLKASTHTSTVDVSILERVMYRIIALLVSEPANIPTVSPSVFQFLLSHHAGSQCDDVVDGTSWTQMSSRYVWFSLACIFWGNEGDDPNHQSQETAQASHTDADREQTTVLGGARIDDIVDNPTHLNSLLSQIQRGLQHSQRDSPEMYLQTLLLHNISFRCNKAEVARCIALHAKTLAETCTSLAILSLVSGTLFCLCQDYETHRVLHDTGTLSVIPTLMSRSDNDFDTQVICLETVCVVFDGRMLSRLDLVELMVRMTPALVDLCGRDNTELRAGCAGCFARFASIEECRSAMAQHGVTHALAVLANEEDTRTLRLCVYAYSYLSRDPVICAQLIASGIVKSLTFLAAAPEEAVRRACAMTLCNLSTAEENIGALAKAGALKALLVISCVKSNDPETRRICLKAMMNLLRLPTNIPLLCQDGLLWAFGLFAAGMEAKDFDLLCEAFCALAFFPTTRKGVVKPAILAAFFQVFNAPSATVGAKIKLLRGLSNVLCDLPNASQLIHAGVLSHLLPIISSPFEGHQATEVNEVQTLVAQILVLLFQSSPDAESEFTQPHMLEALWRLVQIDYEDCSRSCSILLYQMSLHSTTRGMLLHPVSQSGTASLVSSLPALLRHSTRDTQSLLVRLLYNVSCDPALNARLDTFLVVNCVASAIPKKMAALPLDVAQLCAGLLRNLSNDETSHEALVHESATALIKKLFEVDLEVCKEDVAVCLCNVFMGRVNSNLLLSRSVLPIVLWLCSSRAALDSRVLATTVVRKLALAPGNAQPLVDGGVISHLALLMQDRSSVVIKTNCIATFCCVSRKPGTPALLASYGVIGSVLELLQTAGSDDPLLEGMCVDLLSSLAKFARADDALEGKLASLLYQLIDKDDGAAHARAPPAWQTDRTFLQRGVHSPLPRPTPSLAHQRVTTKPPTLRHTLYPVRFAGYSVDFSQMTSHLVLHAVEPVLPELSILGEPLTPPTARRGLSSAPPPASFEFSPLPMFPKLLTAFPASPSAPPPRQI